MSEVEGADNALNGGADNDTIAVGDGDDVITGSGGRDGIVGGRGNDTLIAGNSSPQDTFVIRDGDGSDVITDLGPFEPDMLAFNMADIQSDQDVLDRISQDGPDTVITYDSGETTRLKNVESADLAQNNFSKGNPPPL